MIVFSRSLIKLLEKLKNHFWTIMCLIFLNLRWAYYYAGHSGIGDDTWLTVITCVYTST